MSALQTALDASPEDATLVRMKSLLQKNCGEKRQEEGSATTKSALEEEMGLLLEQHAEVVEILEGVKEKLKNSQESSDLSYEKLAAQEQAVRLANERIVLLQEALKEAQAKVQASPSQEQMAEAQEQIFHLREQLEEFSGALAKGEAREASLKEELEKAQQQPPESEGISEEKAQELRDRIDRLQTENDALSNSLKEAPKKGKKRGDLGSAALKEELEKALKRAIQAEGDAVRAEAKLKVLESRLGSGQGKIRLDPKMGSSEKALGREVRSLQKELDKERKERQEAEQRVQSLQQETKRLAAQIVTGEGLTKDTLKKRIEAEEYQRAKREALWLFGQDPRDDELRRLIIRLNDVLTAVQ